LLLSQSSHDMALRLSRQSMRPTGKPSSALTSTHSAGSRHRQRVAVCARDPDYFGRSPGPFRRVSRNGQHGRLIRGECGAHSHVGNPYDDNARQCLIACVPSLVPMAQPAAAVEQDFPDNQALLPVAAVFFLPKNSALSALALDIVAQAAHQADAEAIVLIRANHDREAGETAQTALLRGDAVRDELIRQGVPKSAVRILISAATRTGIEARSVVVSFPAAIDESRGMTSCS
jgi:hypothetical protein